MGVHSSGIEGMSEDKGGEVSWIRGNGPRCERLQGEGGGDRFKNRF